MTFKQINEWEVLTPSGWSDFKGIKKTSTHEKCIELELSNGSSLTSSLSHRVKVADGNFKHACELEIGDVLFSNNDVRVADIRIVSEKTTLYDLLNVEFGQEYYTNGIVSHNCAWIPNADELWAGLYPTISATGGKCILLSTPNGVGGMFHKVYTDSEAGLNDFNPICLPWNVHPEHDDAWFENEARQLGSKTKVAQELLCSFLSSGDTFLTVEDIEWVDTSIQQPIDKWATDRSLWVWSYPKAGHRYLISGDVARGDAFDFSAFHVIDMDESDVVAEYKGRIPPDQFAQLLNDTGMRYNKALLAPENNTFGYAVIMKLRELGYPRVYKMNSKAVYIVDYSPVTEDLGSMGFSTNGATRIKVLSKLEEVLRNKLIKVHSSRLYDELKTFVWTGQRAQAMKGYNDDLVMSLAIGLWLFDVSDGYCNRDVVMAENMLKSMGVSSQRFDEMPGSGKEIQRNANPYRRHMERSVPIIFGDSDAKRNDPRFDYVDFEWVIK